MRDWPEREFYDDGGRHGRKRCWRWPLLTSVGRRRWQRRYGRSSTDPTRHRQPFWLRRVRQGRLLLRGNGSSPKSGRAASCCRAHALDFQKPASEKRPLAHTSHCCSASNLANCPVQEHRIGSGQRILRHLQRAAIKSQETRQQRPSLAAMTVRAKWIPNSRSTPIRCASNAAWVQRRHADAIRDQGRSAERAAVTVGGSSLATESGLVVPLLSCPPSAGYLSARSLTTR